MLRFDGFYVGPAKLLDGGKMICYDYLRFYSDGQMLTCVSTGMPEEVAVWFYRENPAQSTLLRGPYSLQGREITFSPEFRDMDEGQEILYKSDYRGTLAHDGEAMNLYRGESTSAETYRFVPLALMPPGV